MEGCAPVHCFRCAYNRNHLHHVTNTMKQQQMLFLGHTFWNMKIGDTVCKAKPPQTKRNKDSIHNSPQKSTCAEVSDILFSINKKLSGLYSRIALLEIMQSSSNCAKIWLRSTLTTKLKTVIKENRRKKKHAISVRRKKVRSCGQQNLQVI